MDDYDILDRLYCRAGKRIFNKLCAVLSTEKQVLVSETSSLRQSSVTVAWNLVNIFQRRAFGQHLCGEKEKNLICFTFASRSVIVSFERCVVEFGELSLSLVAQCERVVKREAHCLVFDEV